MNEDDIRPGQWHWVDTAVNPVNGFWMYWVEKIENGRIFYYAINFTYTSGDDGQDWVLGDFSLGDKLFEDLMDVFINYARNFLNFEMYCELPYEHHHALDWVRV